MKHETTAVLELAMLSDWHIGTGSGRPYDVDSLIVRDSNGLPYIPAKTLVGIWRDACERVALGLDDNTAGGWTKWVTALFGDEPNRAGGAADPGDGTDSGNRSAPSPALLSVRPASLPQSLRARLMPAQPGLVAASAESREQLRTAITFVKPGVMIDPASGGAREDFLRMVEMARGGITLTAQYSLETVGMDAAQQEAAQALLVAGAAMIERVGGKRRRGHGRCSASVQGKPLDKTLRFIEQSAKKTLAAPPPRIVVPAPGSITSVVDTAGWHRVPLVLELETPVVAQAATVGNVVESLNYIPGSLLLPIVARALRTEGNSLDTEIARGDLIVLPATLDIEGQRALPVPMVFFRPKNDTNIDRALNGFIEPDDGQEQRRPLRSDYMTLPKEDDQQPLVRSLHPIVNSHSTIDEGKQRPTADVGGVFSYEAIPAGTRLRSEIMIRSNLIKRDTVGGRKTSHRHEQRTDQWWDRLTGDVRIGRSKKDDYGLVRMTAGKAEPVSSEIGINSPTASDDLLIWLVSDLLIRDGGLRADTTLRTVQDVLAKALAPAVPMTIGQPRGPGLIGAEIRTRRYESWHATWGLPRPSLVAIQAGSCFRITLDRPATADVLSALEIQGLGERRAEGFGQIKINHPLLTKPMKTREKPPSTTALAPPRTFAPLQKADPAFGSALAIERAAWREAIRQKALTLGFDRDLRAKVLGFSASKPNSSQLGTLRAKVSRLKAVETTAGPFTAWITSLQNRRQDHWPEKSLTWLLKLVSDPRQVWTDLNISVEALTQGAERHFQEQLWAEAVIALVGAAVRGQTLDLSKKDQADA